jgi:hypothetical protein
MAMLLDAFDASSIQNSKEEEDELSKELNKIKLKISKFFNSIVMWFKRKTAIHPDSDQTGKQKHCFYLDLTERNQFIFLVCTP